MIRAISSAPISRMFVEQRIAEGESYSSVVNANEACVHAFTSNPSRFNASVSRLEKYTLLSITRIFAGRPGSIMHGPPRVGRLPQPFEPCLARALVLPDLGFQSRRQRAKSIRQRAANPIPFAAPFPR